MTSPTAPAELVPPHDAKRAPSFRELDRRGKIVRLLGTIAVGYHLAAVLVGGSAGPIRELLSPAFDFYANGLRMTDAWGMFARPPMTTNVTIEAELDDGARVELSTTRATARDPLSRLRDVRIRKIQSKLADETERKRIGLAYLDYFCKKAPFDPRTGTALPVAVRAIEHVHELRDESGEVVRPASTRTLLRKPCPELGWMNPPSSRKTPWTPR